jgi:putative transposase
MTLGMGIVKVEVKIPELRRALESFKNNQVEALERLRQEMKGAVSRYFDQLLNAEMTLFLGQPDQSNNKRNGYYEREFAMKGIGCLRIRMPVDRKGKFASSVLPKNQQLDSSLKEDIAVLHLAGISTRTMAMLSRRILGVEISKQSVSDSLEVIEDKALQWLERPIDEDYWALFIDGTNFRMQRRGSTEKEPSLVVVGINQRNQKSILAIQPGLKDNASSWGEVFSDLAKRGLKTDKVRIGVMDGLPGLETEFAKRFTNAVTARCWVHALKNSLAKTPQRLRAPLHEHIGRVMYATSAALHPARLATTWMAILRG